MGIKIVRFDLDESHAKRATSLAKRATTAQSSANVTVEDAIARGRRCRFYCSLGCTNAAMSCSAFLGFKPEAKEKACWSVDYVCFALGILRTPNVLARVQYPSLPARYPDVRGCTMKASMTRWPDHRPPSMQWNARRTRKRRGM
jgi:hypothetical protein